MKESERDADFVAESPNEAESGEDDESGEDKGEADSDLEQSRGSEEGDSFDVDPETNLSQQARNAHSSHWQPWQDRLLITQIDADRPFLAPRRERRGRWDQLSRSLALAAVRSGPRSLLERTGEACRARFNILKKKYKVRMGFNIESS
jgi:hypothetical protein